MKIEFTKEQFEKLIVLSLTGNIVANSFSEDEPILEYDEITEYLLSCAKEFGLSNMVDYDKETNEYFPSDETQEQVVELLEVYDSNVFVDDLINSLTYRDMTNKYGEDKIEAMSEDEFVAKKEPIFKKYSDEIDENGVENLYIK